MEDAHEDFSKDKKMFDFSNYSTSQNIMIIQTNWWLVKRKMKQEYINKEYIQKGIHKKYKQKTIHTKRNISIQPILS